MYTCVCPTLAALGQACANAHVRACAYTCTSHVLRTCIRMHMHTYHVHIYVCDNLYTYTCQALLASHAEAGHIRRRMSAGILTMCSLPVGRLVGSSSTLVARQTCKGAASSITLQATYCSLFEPSWNFLPAGTSRARFWGACRVVGYTCIRTVKPI